MSETTTKPAHHGPSKSKAANPLTNLIVLVVSLFLVVAAVLAIFSFTTQNNLANVEQNQKTLEQNQQIAIQIRQQINTVVCAMWDVQTPSQRAQLGEARTRLVNDICTGYRGSTVPQPTTATKG